MIKYLYYVQRNYLNNKPIRELLCTDKYIIINNKEINNNNIVGITINNNNDQLFRYLCEISASDLKNFQTTLSRIVNSKGICCKYTYDGKKYLMLPKRPEKMGVWNEGGVIIHQVGINTINRGSEIIQLKDIPKEGLKKFNTEEYYSLWDETYQELLKRYPLYTALSLGFILSYNKYYNDIAQIKYEYQLPYYLLGWAANSVKSFGCAATLNFEQFKFYIEPALSGSLMAINPFGQIYSPFNSRQIQNALEFYVHDFYKWKLNK